MNFKTIAVLTSGGDAPGMNAAIRAIVRSAIPKGIRVLGVRRGYSGLINKDIFEMSIRTVSEIIDRGGTVLYTTRSPEFYTESGFEMAVENCKNLNIDTVLILGGEGSIKGSKKLVERGINCICIPCTIDNDVSCSENSVGFDTAVNTAMVMIDKIRDTAQAHDRCSVVEVMGKECGNIALHTGIAVGATAILIPECEYDFKRDVIDKIDFTQKMGKKHFIVIVAEGLKIANKISKEISDQLDIETRTTILGYVQRGGTPSASDRALASTFGCYSIYLVENNIHNKVISIRNNKIIPVDICEAISTKRKFNIDMYKNALDISI